jgi:hypothetical protein
MSNSKRIFVVSLFVIAAAILAFSAIRAESYIQEADRYIEVCARGTVYVPANVSFVKCYGVIRKVAFITETITEEEDDCKCPKCCDGLCYIIIFGDPDPVQEKPDSTPDSLHPRVIKYIWLPC